MISSSQRPLPGNTQHLQQTDIHVRSGIQTHNLRDCPYATYKGKLGSGGIVPLMLHIGKRRLAVSFMPRTLYSTEKRLGYPSVEKFNSVVIRTYYLTHLQFFEGKFTCVIQINHQLDATISPVFYLTFIYSSTCFGRPHAHRQKLNNCSSSLWFLPSERGDSTAITTLRR